MFTLAVIGLCAWLRLPPRDWGVMALAMTLVWAAELFNTAIEAVVDLLSPDHHTLAKMSKDTAAGAVLVAAIGAALVGLSILGPPLWQKFQSLIR